jgi:hypothetical protein
MLPRDHAQFRFPWQPGFRFLPLPACTTLPASIDDKYLDEPTFRDCVFYLFRVPGTGIDRLHNGPVLTDKLIAEVSIFAFRGN